MTILTRAAALAAATLTALAPQARPQSRTSAVHQLKVDSGSRVVGHMRQLRCRGKPGIDLKIQQEPSPRDSRMVTMVLRYGQVQRQRALQQVGMGSVDRGEAIVIVPGSCSWSSPGQKDVPPEPGVVYFDLPRDGQVGVRPGMRDTAFDAAETFPDATNLPRYLNDPDRWWMFFVDDVSNLSISFGSMKAYRPPNHGTAVGGASGSASTTRSGAAAASGHDLSSTRSAPGTSAAGTRSVTVPGITTTRPAAGSSDATGTRSGTRPAGNATATTDRVVRAPLQLEGVNTVLGGFTVRFSARARSSPTLLYGTEKPVRDRQTNLWVFPGGRAASGSRDVARPGGGTIVLPGSDAVVAGTQAQVIRQSTQAFRAQYTATSRPRTVGRGVVYHYIITVPYDSDGPAEQYVGELTTVSQTVRTTITSFTVLKSSIYAQNLQYDFVAWTDVGRGGPFDVCQRVTCENTGDYLRLLVFATPRQSSGSVFTTPGWNTQPSVIMGIARREFDLRTIPDDRPLRSFTLRSQAGDIEFEVQGTLQVVRR